MAETYDVIICGAGSGGGFLAGEIAPYGSLLILDAGPHIGGRPNPGVGSPERRRFSTQINLGRFVPDGVNAINRGSVTFNYPVFLDESDPFSSKIQREARIVGGGSHINIGAWLRPRKIDWDGFAEETGIVGWTKEAFEPHYQKAERILHVHRDKPENWTRGCRDYFNTARSMGLPVFATASNRFHCIFCGQRFNAGMPCKYDALMSTAVTQIPKALDNGAVLVDNATVVKVEITNRRATGVVYRKDGQLITANARKLVVVSGGAIGTPLVLINSDVHHVNDNVGRFLKQHPAMFVEALMPGDDWNNDRGWQWNVHHYVMDSNGEPIDVVVFPSASFANTPWLAAQVGFFGRPYKNLMRKYRQRIGVLMFEMKPAVVGRVIGSVDGPIILFPMVTREGRLEAKSLREFKAGVRQAAEVFRRMGAIATFPNPDEPEAFLESELLIATTGGAIHSQGTCRAGADPNTSVVDSNCMVHGFENLMCCDASVIPSDIAANPNATIMAIASRCSEFVITQILGGTIQSSPEEQGEPHGA